MEGILGRIRGVSIYGFMIAFLLFLGIASNLYMNFFLSENPSLLAEVFARLFFVPVFAALLDVAIKHFLLKRPFALPKTALISGLFVAGILDPSAPLYAPFAAAAIAIISKHIIRGKGRNIFNPAAFGITLSIIVFTYAFGVKVFAAWWISSTFLAIPLGLFISYKMEKLPLTLSFFATYCAALLLLFGASISSFTQPIFASIFLFFASFMLLEPRTSPYTFRGMVLSGVCAGILCAVLPLAALPLDFTLVSLLAMNIFKGVLDRSLPDKPTA